jgi:homoserine kinase
VAGAFLARVRAGDGVDPARRRAFEVAAELEGHAENAAASAFGDFVVVADGRATPLRFPPGADLVVWSPAASTSTDASRRSLPTRVALDDAVANIAGAAAWVAAVASGDLSGLRSACSDRLHQGIRLAARPDVAAVLGGLLDRGDVLAAWLSGSGPSVAALVDAELAPVVAAAVPVPSGGSVRVLSVDRTGVTVADDAILD